MVESCKKMLGDEGDNQARVLGNNLNRRDLQFFTSLVGRLREPVYILEAATGRVVEFNECAKEASGKDRDELVRSNVGDLLPAFVEELSWNDHVSEVRKRGSLVTETRFVDNDGVESAVCVESGCVVCNGSEFVVLVIRVSSGCLAYPAENSPVDTRAQEVTPEYRTASSIPQIVPMPTKSSGVKPERRVSEVDESLRGFIEDSLDAVLTVSTNGRILDVNLPGAKLLGYSTVKEATGVDITADLMDRRSYWKPIVEAVGRNGFIRDLEAVLTNRALKKIYALISAAGVRASGGSISAYKIVIRDTSALRRLEQQLIQAQKMEPIGQLTGGIAHDFNNMLMAILGYTTIMRTRISDADTALDYIDRINEVTKRAMALTHRLLAFSRNQIICLKPTDINEIVSKAEKLLLRLIGEDIDFKTFHTREKLTVMADSGQIEQVLMNLSTNARDSMPSGGFLLISTSSVTIDDEFIRHHGYGEPGRYACITVIDTGCGMPPETLEKVFDPFFTTKEVGKGTGLGLSVVYGIIKQHKGNITVLSKPGMGTNFKIYLPAVDCEAADTEEPADRSPRPGTGTVLIAEDDSEVRGVTRTLLEDFGYKVIEAVDGTDAVVKFKENRNSVDLLLMDVIMPRMSGKEAYDNISTVRPDVGVIFLSGYTEDIITREGLRQEGIHFISKPVVPSELLEAIRDVIGTAKSETAG